MKPKPRLHGVIVPAITFVDDNDRVEELAYRNLLRRLIEAGVHGIFAGGSAGEGPLLTLREWERVMIIAFDECRGKIPLLGGSMDTSTQRIIERLKILAEIGYEFFVVTPTFYGGSKLAEEQLRLFGECREHCDGMEMIAYNIPACTGSVISVETMCNMARRGWIRYCKDSSDDIRYFQRLVSEGEPLGLEPLIGSERNAAEGLLLGACGLVPVCANYNPSTYLAAHKARTDKQELTLCQNRINSMVQSLVLEPRSWLAGIKYAVSLTGIGSGKPVSPLESLNADEKRLINSFVQNDSVLQTQS